MRFPECIHIADKHFNIAHEHIPLGDGRIILEATDTKSGIEKSKQIMNDLFGK